MCGGKVVGLVSHKFNFSEQCVEVSPFYYSRIDWSASFRRMILEKKSVGRSLLISGTNGLEICQVGLIIALICHGIKTYL